MNGNWQHFLSSVSGDWRVVDSGDKLLTVACSSGRLTYLHAVCITLVCYSDSSFSYFDHISFQQHTEAVA